MAKGNNMQGYDLLKTIAIDFDGVINCRFGDGVIDHKRAPIEGTIYSLYHIQKIGFSFFIHTARPTHQLAEIKSYILEWAKSECIELDDFEVTNVKLPAFMYIDDRAVRFTNWNDICLLLPFNLATDWNVQK